MSPISSHRVQQLLQPLRRVPTTDIGTFMEERIHFVCLFLKFMSVSANFGLIGHPREREADSEKPRRWRTLFRWSTLDLLYAQCMALIHGTFFKVTSKRLFGPAGDRTHSPWLNSLACYP